MKILKQLISTVALSMLASTAVAQTEETSGNIIGGTWNGAITNTTVIPGDGSHNQASGPFPIYNPDTNTIVFSYNFRSVAQVIGVNTALANSGSGLQVSGINYSWQYYNQDFNRGTLSSSIWLFDSTNATRLEQYSYTMPQTTNGWTQFSGSETFGNIYDLTQLGNLSISFGGRDDRGWAGYYGPMVRDVDVRLRYSVTPVDPCVSDPQSSPSCPGYKTFYTIPDDGNAIVPIPFGFPLYGQTFTHSIFFDNGAVSFYTPGNANHPQRFGGGGLGSININESLPSSFFYTIIPLRTDLIANQGRHFTQGDSNYLRYTWEDVSQFGRWDSRNTFSLEIRPTGYIGLQYDKVDIQGSWTSAIIGNASLGEYQTIQSNTSTTTTAINSWSINETVATDCSNPLNHVNCPGYADAYFDQQCSINALYSSNCPGYADAYFTQQCSINTLYSPGCPGYADAYFAQQCSINALYDPACPGYATAYYNYQCSLNALYHTGCPGYADAYFDQQCGLDPFYNNQCPGYAVAFYDLQCSLDPLYDEGCLGYADAYYVQQCNLDPLYDSGCNGYADAFFAQQCSLDALYDSTCPDYETAYFNYQCSLNGLYDRQCPNFLEAFSNKLVDDGQCITTKIINSTATQPIDAVYCVSYPKSDLTLEKSESTSTLLTEINTAQETSLKINDLENVTLGATRLVTETISQAEITAADKTSPTSLESLSAAPAAPVAAAASTTRTATPARAAPATTRQALAEQRLAAARAQAEQRARENPDETAEAMDTADSMEQQAELQNVVIGAMGFVPGFDAYGRATVPDAAFYPPFEIYPGQQNIDTPAARGLLGRSDRLHQEMVDEQYR